MNAFLPSTVNFKTMIIEQDNNIDIDDSAITSRYIIEKCNLLYDILH